MAERFRNFFSHLGPGIITGASDDDPSGILTYLQTGVVLGLTALWTALFTFPLMCAIQEMAARISYVSGKGLMQLMKERISRPFAYTVALILSIVMVINIGADLYALGVIFEHFFSINHFVWVIIVSVVALASTVFFSFGTILAFLKWLVLALVFYIAAVFYLHIDIAEALRATIVPKFSLDAKTLFLLAAVFGTTISPYLFFWQASEEMETRSPGEPAAAVHQDLRSIRQDTFMGMFFSNLIMWFIIAGGAAAAATYHFGEIQTFSEAASVLEPLLGHFSFLVFSLGIIGTGLIAIPVLAGSIGYITSEVFDWKEGMNLTFREGHGFYGAIILATLLAIFVVYLEFDPIKLLILTAALYAIVTPPIIYAIIKLANDKETMASEKNGWLSNAMGGILLVVMTAVSIASIISLLS